MNLVRNLVIVLVVLVVVQMALLLKVLAGMAQAKAEGDEMRQKMGELNAMVTRVTSVLNSVPQPHLPGRPGQGAGLPSPEHP